MNGHSIYEHQGKNIIMNKQRQPVECYSRVVGYLRPVKQWNDGKQNEFADRKNFKIYGEDNKSDG